MNYAYKQKMIEQLQGKDMLTLLDYTTEEIVFLLDYAIELKLQYQKEGASELLKGKTLGMIFEKHSTRTRISFEVGMQQLGGYGMFMNAKDLQIGRGETVHDTGKAMSEYLDGIMIRANSHDMVKELAEHASIPVINGLTDIFHPCQALADMLTLIELKGDIKGLKLAYIGDGNNVAHSLMIAGAHLGLHLVVASPKGYEFSSNLVPLVQALAKKNGGSFTLTNDPLAAATDADAIYTDVWTSMGQEEETAQRLKDFKGFQINHTLTSYAKKDYTFLHCLPAHRGEEVATEIIDGEHSYVFHQAGNRLHAQKAVLAALLV